MLGRHIKQAKKYKESVGVSVGPDSLKGNAERGLWRGDVLDSSSP